MSKFFKPLEIIAFSITLKFVETKFGKFYVRANTMDSICVSPAFERLDINLLFDLIKSLKREEKKVLFLDIGADIGTYSITIGNYFRKYKNLNIIAIEPDKQNFNLLIKNLKLNNLQIKAYNYALSNKNSFAFIKHDNLNPGGSEIGKVGERVVTKKLDSLKIKNYDVLIFKLDVEGYEQKVIEGAKNTLKNTKSFFLVEDFIKKSIMKFMVKNKFKFITKLTPYNSWWIHEV